MSSHLEITTVAMRKRPSLLLIAATAYSRWSYPVVDAFLSPAPHLYRRAPPLPSTNEDDSIAKSANASTTIVDDASLALGKSSLWKIGSTEVNFAEKYFVLHNFTIDNSVNSTFTEYPFALSVERVKVAWDNLWYTTRTFEVEMETVDFVLEFTSLKLLSESNWDELVDQDLFEWLMADYDELGNKYDEAGFFHFSSFQFLGNATIHVLNRPLGTSLGCIRVDASNSLLAKGFNTKIGKRSDENLLEKGRKGIMFAELADLAKETLDELLESRISGIFKTRK